MKTNRFNINEKDLRSGYQFRITTINKEQECDADLSFESKRNRFYIWFNGKYIHSCVTFGSLLSRLNKLNESFPLEDGSTFI